MADNPPAFPTPSHLVDTRRRDGGIHPRLPIVCTEGMSLRDWFAGQALTGLCARGEGDAAPGYAYWLADAMLAARTSTTGGEE